MIRMEEFIDECKRDICIYYKENVEEIDKNDVFEIWSCKTLQNKKAILATLYNDTRLFEMTYNGDKNEIYMDCYVKEKNMKIEL